MAVSEHLTDGNVAVHHSRAEELVEHQIAERAARLALKSQIARLERDLSKLVAGGFPHIHAMALQSNPHRGARLLTLEELELLRDRMVLGLQHARTQTTDRVALELRSQELLERIKLEPGRYKFTRLPLADLGQGKCGVWQVRPRLGLVGMLAGWWELKLSSGCPLPRGRAQARPVPS